MFGIGQLVGAGLGGLGSLVGGLAGNDYEQMPVSPWATEAAGTLMGSINQNLGNIPATNYDIWGQSGNRMPDTGFLNAPLNEGLLASSEALSGARGLSPLTGSDVDSLLAARRLQDEKQWRMANRNQMNAYAAGGLSRLGGQMQNANMRALANEQMLNELNFRMGAQNQMFNQGAQRAGLIGSLAPQGYNLAASNAGLLDQLRGNAFNRTLGEQQFRSQDRGQMQNLLYGMAQPAINPGFRQTMNPWAAGLSGIGGMATGMGSAIDQSNINQRMYDYLGSNSSMG